MKPQCNFKLVLYILGFHLYLQASGLYTINQSCLAGSRLSPIYSPYEILAFVHLLSTFYISIYFEIHYNHEQHIYLLKLPGGYCCSVLIHVFVFCVSWKTIRSFWKFQAVILISNDDEGEVGSWFWCNFTSILLVITVFICLKYRVTHR